MVSNPYFFEYYSQFITFGNPVIVLIVIVLLKNCLFRLKFNFKIYFMLKFGYFKCECKCKVILLSIFHFPTTHYTFEFCTCSFSSSNLCFHDSQDKQILMNKDPSDTLNRDFFYFYKVFAAKINCAQKYMLDAFYTTYHLGTF